MPQQGINFDGAFIAIPGAYYADDVSAAAPTTPPVTPPMVFLGYGYGPKPKTPVTFTNAQDLQNALRGGPAAAFLPFISNPSPALNGAQLITFIDVSTNTQSSIALKASGAGTYATLTSAQYGPPSNLMQAEIQAGSTAGIKLTIIDGFADRQIVGDNLTVPFQMAYTGSATGSISYTVTSAAFTLTSPNAGESVTFPLGANGYIQTSQLVAAINGTGFYLAAGLSASNGLLPATELSPVSGVTLPPVSGSVPQYVNVRAFLNDIPFWVNQFASSYATAASGGTAVDNATWLPVNIPPTFFSGATGVPPTNNDYAAGFNVALTTPGWTVFADSNLPAVQALLAQHCETASSVPYGMWRRGFTGSSLGDSVNTTIANATALDTYTVAYTYPGIQRVNTQTGVNQTYPGLYVAAAAAAMAAGNQIAIPLTNKVLNGTGVEQTLTQSQLVQLQNNGVMALFQPIQTNLPTILSDITTWQVDDNAENTSAQQVACRFWLAYSVVNTLRQYVGTIASPVTEVNILKALIKTLNALIYTGGSNSGVLVSWDRSSLNLVYTGTNQVAAITFNAVLVGQNRFITCFVPIQPLNISISAASIT